MVLWKGVEKTDDGIFYMDNGGGDFGMYSGLADCVPVLYGIWDSADLQLEWEALLLCREKQDTQEE